MGLVGLAANSFVLTWSSDNAAKDGDVSDPSTIGLTGDLIVPQSAE